MPGSCTILHAMPSLVRRLTPHVLGAWLMVGALVPRVSPLRPLYLVNTYVVVPALLGAALLDYALRHRRRWALRIRLSDLTLAVFMLWAAVSIFLHHDPDAIVRRQLIELWRAFAVPIAAFWTIRLARPRAGAFAGWLAPLVALCTLEVGIGFLAWLRPSALPPFWPGLVEETGGARITGTLPQPDVYAALLVFCATIVVQVGAGAVSKADRVLAGTGVALAFTGVFLSFSRASWLGGLIALAILVASYGRRLAVPCVVIALAVLGLSRVRVGSAPLPESSKAPGAQALQGGGYAGSRLTMAWTIRDRAVLDAAGTKMFLAKPLLGWGFGSYDRHARGFVTPVGPFFATDWDRNEAASHCTHLSILAETGLVGYALLAAPAVQLVVAAARRRQGLRRDRYFLGLCATAAFLAVVSALIDLRYVAYSLDLAAVVVGLIAVRMEADGSEG